MYLVNNFHVYNLYTFSFWKFIIKNFSSFLLENILQFVLTYIATNTKLSIAFPIENTLLKFTTSRTSCRPTLQCHQFSQLLDILFCSWLTFESIDLRVISFHTSLCTTHPIGSLTQVSHLLPWLLQSLHTMVTLYLLMIECIIPLYHTYTISHSTLQDLAMVTSTHTQIHPHKYLHTHAHIHNINYHI
jgi:hypothetical protein